jgi:hypothetical protein
MTMLVPPEIVALIFSFSVASPAEWLSTITEYGKDVKNTVYAAPILFKTAMWHKSPEALLGKYRNIIINSKNKFMFTHPIIAPVTRKAVKNIEAFEVDKECYDINVVRHIVEVISANAKYNVRSASLLGVTVTGMLIFELFPNIEHIEASSMDAPTDEPKLGRLKTFASRQVSFGFKEYKIGLNFTSLRHLVCSYNTQIHNSVCARLTNVEICNEGGSTSHAVGEDYCALHQHHTENIFPNLHTLHLKRGIPTLSSFSSLVVLKLTGVSNDITEIPKELVNLRELYMDSCERIRGDIPDTIKKLEILVVKSCRAFGYDKTLPARMDRIKVIKLINISDECFKRPLPYYPTLRSYKREDFMNSASKQKWKRP